MDRNLGRRGLVLLGAVFMTAGLLACGRQGGTAGLYGKDKKLRRDITLEEIRSAEAVHGDLIGVSYDHGGGMNGETDSLTLTRDGDQGPMIRTRKAAFHSFPLIVREYRAEETVFGTLEDLIRKDNLTLWADLPEEEYEVLDAPETSLTFIYDETDLGGSAYETYTISFDNVIPEGGREILWDFAKTLGEAALEENCLDRYFEWNGDRIEIGRDKPNTEEEIALLVSGYWTEPGGDKADNTLILLGYSLEDPMDFYIREDGTSTEWPLSFKGIVHEPWKEADCGWQIRLADEDKNLWILYMEDLSLKLVRDDGSASYTLERQN